MSNTTDKKLASEQASEQALDEYLLGASAYSQLYRDDAADDVPLDLDRAVLAEARAALTGRKTFVWQKVTPILAIAATAVLTLSIVVRSGLETSAPQSARVSETLAKKDAASVRSVESEPEIERMTPAPAAEEEATRVKSEQSQAAPPRQQRDEARKKLAIAGSTKAAAGSTKPAPVTVREPAPLDALETKATPDLRAQASGKSSGKSADMAATESLAQRSSNTAVPRAIPPAPSRANANAVAATSLEEVLITSEKSVDQRGAGPRGTVPVPELKDKTVETSVNDMSEVVVTGSLIRDSRAQGAGPRGSVPPASQTPAERKDEQQYREANPAIWLSYIQELREAGKNRNADREWERFVKAYPNYKVDANDSARPKATAR